MFNNSGKNFSTLVDYSEGFFYTVVFRVVFAFALMFFLWNVYQLVKDGGDATKRKDHQKAIMWSVIALAAMFSVWALVNIVTGSFGEPTVLPQIDSQYLDSF